MEAYTNLNAIANAFADFDPIGKLKASHDFKDLCRRHHLQTAEAHTLLTTSMEASKVDLNAAVTNINSDAFDEISDLKLKVKAAKRCVREATTEYDYARSKLDGAKAHRLACVSAYEKRLLLVKKDIRPAQSEFKQKKSDAEKKYNGIMSRLRDEKEAYLRAEALKLYRENETSYKAAMSEQALAMSKWCDATNDINVAIQSFKTFDKSVDIKLYANPVPIPIKNLRELPGINVGAVLETESPPTKIPVVVTESFPTKMPEQIEVTPAEVNEQAEEHLQAEVKKGDPVVFLNTVEDDNHREKVHQGERSSSSEEEAESDDTSEAKVQQEERIVSGAKRKLETTTPTPKRILRKRK